MQIKVLVSCSGVDFSYAQGSEIDVPEDIGKDLVSAGYAEEIKAAPKAKSKVGAKEDADA